MVDHDIDSASDSGVSGDWEQLGGGRGKNGGSAHGQHQGDDDGQGGASKKGGKSASSSL